jgi:phosphoglycerol transferase MdoB-like AlkP superfamily enzyme
MTINQIKNNWLFEKVSVFFTKLGEKRKNNSEKYKKTNWFMMLFFPIFIVCMAEINQSESPLAFFQFVASSPLIMLFNIIISAIIFTALNLLIHRGWLSMLIQSFGYMILSITELFKYNTNGNHLTVTDFSLAKSLESLASFAYIKITVMLIVYVALILIYIALAFWFNPKIRLKWTRSIISSACGFALCLSVVVFPTFGNTVYAIFGIDTSTSKNTFILNEKFENNGLLAFFLQDSTETLENKLSVPDNYCAEAVDTYLEEATTEPKESSTTEKPNVIVIMSESYADFRVFDELDIDDDIYSGFDAVANDENAYSGYSIVPTYASYTVRTEFELLFGLPVKSMNDANMPQRLLLDRKQTTIPAYYKSFGYNTAYVHPYQSTFYGREYIYSNYSFDDMIFIDDFDAENDSYGNYIDDSVVFDKLENLIEDSDEPMFIHTTTMQNHQPYDQGDDPDDQFTNYLNQIKHTSDSLETFVNDLKDIDEPTIVLYIGDHFPSLRGEDSVYNQLGITSKNCSTLYEQHYILWSNYDVDYSVVPDEKFSVFYMPYIMMQLADIGGDDFINTMIDKMQTTPVYSTNYDPDGESDEELDMLTYDRVLGEQISDNPLSELYPLESTSEN